MKATVGSVCFVCAGDQVLLMRRNRAPFKGKWDGLGGLVQFGELPAAAAVREVHEESGITLFDCDHRGNLLLYNAGSESAIVVDLFVATYDGEPDNGKLVQSEEGVPSWVPVDSLDEVDLVGFVRVTLPLILVPDTFLTGIVRHTSKGEPVKYKLQQRSFGTPRTYQL